MNYLLILFLILTPRSGDHTENTADVCLSAEEKKLYEVLNAYRETLDLKSIQYSPSLSMVAQAHVKDLAENYDYLSQGKCNPHSWSKKGKWKGCCYTSDHKKPECMWEKPMEIANYNSKGYEILYFASNGATAAAALKGWQESPSHHPVMINSGVWEQADWNAMGVGIYREYAAVWFGVMEEPGVAIKPCN